MANENDTAARSSLIVDRSVRLFYFLRELAAARLATTRDVADYEDVIWLSEIPHESGWYCAAWNVDPAERAQVGEEVWLRATKPKISPPPKFPSVLDKWLNESEIADFKREELPSLQAEIFETIKEKNELGELVERVVSHRLEDNPNVIEAHREWGEKFWRPWAAESLKLQPIQEVYGKLFALYQKQKRLGESYEVVIGLGLFTWKPEGQSPIRRHLVTAQTELTFEGGRGVLSVTAAADGAKLLLEQDMLDVKHRPGNDREITETLRTIDENWWDQNQIEPALRSWTNFFASNGQYHHLIDRQAAGAEVPTVHFAPALILRKRTARTLIQVFDSIAKQLKDLEESDVPFGVKSIVATISPGSGVDQGEDSGNGHITGDGEIYFPLPYNEQQRRIVDKCNSNHGVVVQGPPGTGKSQTVANLICHLLASGKRVLITSQTEIFVPGDFACFA